VERASPLSCELLFEGGHLADVTAEATTGITSGDPLSAESDLIAVGTRVEVRSRFIGSWSRGFEVAEHRGTRYGIKRLSDQSILPDDFEPSEVRAERRKHDYWWY
jgi:hypothetical protein